MSSLSPKRKCVKTLTPAESAKKPVLPHGVFLGGACNPTTWRKDIAVPFLEENNIPYYNPQVDEWCPELIEKEAKAKEQANFLLFVFQPHLTRALASLIEVAYLAARVSSQYHVKRMTPQLRSRHPRLLIIVRPPPQSSSIHPDKKSDTIAEAASLDAAYEWLEGLHLPNVRFFEVLEDALQYIKNFYSYVSPSPKSSQPLSRSSWRKARRMVKRCIEPAIQYNLSNVSHERLMTAYKFSASCEEMTTDSHVDFYFGGSTPKKMQMTGTYRNCASWVVSRQGTKRNFALSMAVQSQCSRLYFHISRTGLWIVDQLEAAFAIGIGKEVFLCVESLHDEDTYLCDVNSNCSSGYGSLASTPDENFHRPTGITNISASTTSAPSRSSSSSEYEEATPIDESFKPPSFTIPENDAVLKALNKHSRDMLLPTSDVFGLPPCAVKDHNRSRSYLKSLIEEISEETGKCTLLDHPVESIDNLIDKL